MGKNGAKDNDNIIELSGWEFRKVKDGLDETQVASLLNELINQRDSLTQRTEHLSSLTKLAERTVTEADKLAEEMTAKVIDQAKAEAAEIIAEAEARAQRMEAENKRNQLELRNSVQELYSQLLSGLESLKQKVVALQVESEHKLSQPVEEVSTLITMETDETSAASQEPIPAIEQTEPTVLAEQAPLADDRDITAGERELELELAILPPIDIMKIMEIVTYLDNLPEVENTELIPNTERPSIIVSLREPINLIDMLRTLPEIARIEEDATETTGAEGEPRKIQINLSGKSVPQETR